MNPIYELNITWEVIWYSDNDDETMHTLKQFVVGEDEETRTDINSSVGYIWLNNASHVE